jgi:hypothetical protein
MHKAYEYHSIKLDAIKREVANRLKTLMSTKMKTTKGKGKKENDEEEEKEEKKSCCEDHEHKTEKKT